MNPRSAVGEDMLRWASERGSGTWGLFRDTAAYALTSRGHNLRPWVIATRLSSLGHLDVDWEQGLWSVSGPCLVLSQGLGNCGYLTGWRTSLLMQRFNEASDDLDLYPFSIGQGYNPSAFFLKAADPSALQAAAERLDAYLVVDPASQLADRVDLGAVDVLASPPPVDEDLELFDATSLGWESVAGRDVDGLYRSEIYGRAVFRVRRDGDWFVSDRATGQILMLNERDDVIRWRPASGDLRTPRAVIVPRSISLPEVAERAFVSASGLLPEIQGADAVYRNVTRDVARRVAENLGLELGYSSAMTAGGGSR
jgi:hypothetical protein